ncbi:MarC family protein [Thalassomonas sp. RHCl1]|uniref:MarC family protein n=1 Tax=Thalassomonas sp. RHCl1 TaxID=2995320 RepID=UPI00248BB205|nr:MarC family protein [Thalassomonas sp. RHCl1]
MYELFISTFVTFFVVIDPLGIAPVFAVMTDGASSAFKRKMILKSVITGTIILLLFAFVGNGLLKALGISMMAFKTAGGILLFMIALEMVFEMRTERREKKSEAFTHEHEQEAEAGQAAKASEPVTYPDEEFDDISIFPMAIPFIAGPGSIATIMLLMSHYPGQFEFQSVVIGAMLVALISTVVILFAASKIIGMLGQTVANAITRILGVLLAAMATQYIFDGIQGTFFSAGQLS